MKLYMNELAFNPGKVRLALAEMGIACEQQSINLFNGQNVSPEFLKINPTGTVPVLIDGDTKITESRAILEFLDSRGERLGGPQVDAALLEGWLNKLDAWDGNLFVRAFSPDKLQNLMVMLGDFRLKYAEARKKQNPDMAAVYDTKIASMKAQAAEGLDKAAAEANKKQLEGILDEAEQQLASTPWLAGEQYTMADVMLTTILNRVNTTGVTSTYLQSRGKVSLYFNTVKARPSYKATFSPSPAPFLLAVGKATLARITGWY